MLGKMSRFVVPLSRVWKDSLVFGGELLSSGAEEGQDAPLKFSRLLS